MPIASGNPQKSFILLRMSVRDSILQMPPLATFETDTVAVKLVTDWIKSLPIQNSIRFHDSQEPRNVRRTNDLISFTPLLDKQNLRLFTLSGKPVPLIRLGLGIYRFRNWPNSGVFLLRLGTNTQFLTIP